jgi:hypothetical protein
MSTIEPKHRAQVEMWLKRPLTDDELQTVSSFDALTDEQVAIVAAIRPRNLIAPLLFLKAVVPTATHREVVDFMDTIEGVAIVRRPPPELPDQRIFEHFAGRPLEPADRARVGTIYKMNPAQIELVETLARKDRAVAFLYLSRVAPDDSIEVRNELAKHLAGLP